MTDTILILDFGSQVTQLIARRLREDGVYTEILPCTADADRITDLVAKRIVLSGGPNSVALADTPRALTLFLKSTSHFWGFVMASRPCVSNWAARLNRVTIVNLAVLISP